MLWLPLFLLQLCGSCGLANIGLHPSRSRGHRIKNPISVSSHCCLLETKKYKTGCNSAQKLTSTRLQGSGSCADTSSDDWYGVWFHHKLDSITKHEYVCYYLQLKNSPWTVLFDFFFLFRLVSPCTRSSRPNMVNSPMPSRGETVYSISQVYHKHGPIIRSWACLE